jgi:ribonuclease T2
MWRALCCVLGLAGLMVLAAPAQARHHRPRVDSDATAGAFDYYLLSLSWAPTYCLGHGGDTAECGSKGYGFVVHGLWPQFDQGGYPQSCSTSYQLTSDAYAKGQTIYPSQGLMQHEWREHGTCSGLDALGYFQTVDRATAVLKTPPALETPQTTQNLSAGQVVDLFRRANPQLASDGLVVACSRGDLSEIRVCLTKDLALRSCGRGVHSNCPTGTVAIPASR